MGTHYVKTTAEKSVWHGLEFLVDSAVRDKAWTAVIIGVGLLAEDKQGEASCGPMNDTWMSEDCEDCPPGEHAQTC
jgi:hypothetical protein